MSKRIKISIVLSAVVLFALMPIFNLGQATETKQYRFGEIAEINGATYIFTSSGANIDILQVAPDNQIVACNEILRREKIEDLEINYEQNKPYLYVSTGQYIVKYDISSPISPTVEIQRDMYEYRRGYFRNGYMPMITVNDNYVITGGRYGVRSFGNTNLLVDKYFTFNEPLGIASNNEKLAVITNTKGMIFDVNTGNQIIEFDLENINNVKRQPYIDQAGNVYLLSDNALLKVNNNNQIVSEYYNPVSPGITHSYAVDSLVNGKLAYVNGFGLTLLDPELKKIEFEFTANGEIYGPQSWAVGVSSVNTQKGKRIAVFNKSSVVLLDENLNSLDQYRIPENGINIAPVTSELKVTLSKYSGNGGDKVRVYLFGFWPNEEVEVGIDKDVENLKMDAYGYGTIEIEMPEVQRSVKTVKAKGLESKLRYETTFQIY